MAEKRSSALSILLRDQRKTLVKIDLFDAREWDAKTEGYRLRENGAWVCDNGKYTYFTIPALGTYLRWKLAQCLGSADLTDPKEPRIQPGAFVRVMRYDMICRASHMVTARVVGPPIRAIDGKWYVPVDVPYDGKTYAEVAS